MWIYIDNNIHNNEISEITWNKFKKTHLHNTTLLKVYQNNHVYGYGNNISNPEYYFTIHEQQNFGEKVNGTLKVPDKETIRKQFDEYIDIDFIKHMLINRVMDGEQIIKLCSYLMDTVKELQACSRDIEVAVMWENMIDDFREQKITVVDFIPVFFKEIFGVIDKICADVLLLPIIRGTGRM